MALHSRNVHGDVAPFDRLATPYDWLMPSADDESLGRGLSLAERPVESGLDVAGGTGRGARAFDGVEWTVLDAARGMLERARARGLAAVQGDATRLPVRPESIDAVVIIDALHHVGDPAAALAAAADALRSGGVLVVREFDPTTVRGRALVVGEHLVGFDSTFWPPDDLAEMVEAAGLDPAVPDRGFGYTVAGVKRG